MKMAKMGSSKPLKESKSAAIAVPDYENSPPSINLGEKHMEKLGIKKLPRVGSHVKVHAHAKVVSARHDRHGKSLELQFHKMGVGESSADTAEDAIDHGIDEANENT